MKIGSKKRFGQHFLRDTGVADRIVRLIYPGPDDLILDIGAGHGALSTPLAAKASRLLAIEFDIDCISHLEASLAPFASAVVVAEDILKTDLTELIARYLQPGQKLRMVGNLPYNIATAIIEKLLHACLPIEDMVFMVQLEVAERITADPGSRQYGFLSVDCQYHSAVRMAFKVSPACFVPRPRVTSAIVSFQPKRTHLDFSLHQDFEALAKAAFGHRRKTIANALGKHPIFGPISGALLSRAGIAPARRAEELSVQEYEHLAQIYRLIRSTG